MANLWQTSFPTSEYSDIYTAVYFPQFLPLRSWNCIHGTMIFFLILTNTIYKLYDNYGRQVYYVKIGEMILVCNKDTLTALSN